MVAIETLGEGPPLVLVHGVGTCRVVWRRVMPLLATDRLVATPDLPGFGASPAAGPGFDLDRVADVLAEALAGEVPAPFDLLGNSLGGAVALTLAARHPQLVRRLVLAAPAGLAPRRDPLPALAARGGRAVAAARRRAGPALAESALTRRLLLFGMVVDAAGVPAAEARLAVGGSEGATRIGEAIDAVVRADLRPRLPKLAMPVAFLWGDRDRVVPVSSLGALRALVPGAPVEIIARAGHVPQLERPHEFVAAVDRLITVP